MNELFCVKIIPQWIWLQKKKYENKGGNYSFCSYGWTNHLTPSFLPRRQSLLPACVSFQLLRNILDIYKCIGTYACMHTQYEVKWSQAAQLCPTLCNLMDCSLPGSSVHGIFQARILEWVAISFSRRSSQPRDWTRVSRIVGRRFTI